MGRLRCPGISKMWLPTAYRKLTMAILMAARCHSLTGQSGTTRMACPPSRASLATTSAIRLKGGFIQRSAPPNVG